ncbi:MAG: ferredoxin-type protein NapF, partial [Gammaproteobacteria bacterium]|nr:ferredoxin-type protein NapF [Gammaproteobacteria bacterium]
TETCSACADCIDVCPEKILVKGRAGYPVVNFESGECTFCGLCAEVCQPQAISKISGSAPWALKAIIADNCMASNNTICITCQEYCDHEAIQFKPVIGRIATPEINYSNCTGCGACFSPCPTNSISIMPLSQQEQTI